MLVENTREEALKAFLNGNKGTMAAVRMADGGMRFVRISDPLPDDAVYFINAELEAGEDYEEKVLRNVQGGSRKRISLQQIRLLVKPGERKKRVLRRRNQKKPRISLSHMSSRGLQIRRSQKRQG